MKKINLAQCPDQLPYPQGKREDIRRISFRNRRARSICYLRALSFHCLQDSEDQDKHEAEESRGIFYDQIAAEDSEFEFSSPASTPTRGNVLFCGRIMRQRQPMEQEQPNAKMRGLSVSNCSTSMSGKQSQKRLSGMLSFKADTGMSTSEMKKRQKQWERVPLIPTTLVAGTDELESAIASGIDGCGDRHKKTHMGLLRRLKPKGKLPGVLAKAIVDFVALGSNPHVRSCSSMNV